MEVVLLLAGVVAFVRVDDENHQNGRGDRTLLVEVAHRAWREEWMESYGEDLTLRQAMHPTFPTHEKNDPHDSSCVVKLQKNRDKKLVDLQENRDKRPDVFVA